MRWARSNVEPVAILERTAYHHDDAGQNARTIIQQFRYEAERLQAQAEQEAARAISKEATSHTKRWIASVKAGANIDVAHLLHDDDLVDLLSIRSEQFNSLIKNLSQDVLNRVERETLGSIFEGRSNADISKSLQEIDGIGRNRARLIARDQASKLNGAMNEFRQRQAGVESYKWSTILDGRERPSHHARNGKIFSWDKPPPDGAPGYPINCRCRALAIIPDDDTGEPSPASQQEIESDVDFATVESLIERVGLTPSKNVMSWTAEEIADRTSDLSKVLEAVQALKVQSGFDVAGAEKLTKAVFGFLPDEKTLLNLVGSRVGSLFSTRRSILFQAVNSRLNMISELLTQARATAGRGVAAEAVAASEAKIIRQAEIPLNGLDKANGKQVADWYKTTAKLGDADKSALYRYSTGMYSQINGALRTDVPDWLKPIVKDIDAALDKGTVPDGTLLYRGVKSVRGFDRVDDAFKVGGTFSDASYLSTSTDFNEAAGFISGADDRILLVIDAAGKKALPIGSVSGFEFENEVLLARGTKFRVVAEGRYVRKRAGQNLNVRIVKLVAI